MQTILRWTVRCLATTAIVMSLPASAYLQFTYTSQQLPQTTYIVEGDPQELDPPLPPPTFRLSFQAPEQDLSLQPLTHFLAENFTFSLTSPEANYIEYPIDIDPTSYGQISLTGDGTIAGWNLAVQMKELITPETDMQVYEMSDRHVNVISNSETGDQLTFRFHPVTWHRAWIQLIQLEFSFANESERGTWTVEQADLPEPGLAGLLATGLTLLLWSRRRIKA